MARCGVFTDHKPRATSYLPLLNPHPGPPPREGDFDRRESKAARVQSLSPRTTNHTPRTREADTRVRPYEEITHTTSHELQATSFLCLLGPGPAFAGVTKEGARGDGGSVNDMFRLRGWRLPLKQRWLSSGLAPGLRSLRSLAGGIGGRKSGPWPARAGLAPDLIRRLMQPPESAVELSAPAYVQTCLLLARFAATGSRFLQHEPRISAAISHLVRGYVLASIEGIGHLRALALYLLDRKSKAPAPCGAGKHME